ncbi:PTS transporter subunit EIIC [Amygdalobacter indicium]|uniref:Permease IIC component n=1 Tax=Amygdalobacter indicium TaxID=3029272 RepID=A0ABY8C3P4_9FIRM|nr:PTS transporter subunit EIIC [Amygdalobacter indicium]WEG35182.1 PTS transporter subunit EIIC [Amygdalobacter indicium]
MLKELDKILGPVANSLSKNKVLSAIRDGFMVSVPVVIVGSLFLLISNFPISGYEEFMARIFGPTWSEFLGRVTAVAFDCVSLMSTLAIGYCYAAELKLTNKIAAALVALVSFLIVTPQTHLTHVNEAGKAFRGFSFGNFGTAGIFLSMIIAIISVGIFSWAYKRKLVIKLPDGVPPAVMDSFAALIPAAIVMIIFFFVGIIFNATSYGYAHSFIYEVLQAPLVGLGKNKLFEVIYQFLSTLFWFFGINGPAVTNTIFAPIHKALTLENYEAAKAGLAMTNMFTAGFSDFFCNFGGGGSTLGLVIMMAFIGKSNRIKMLGRLSLPAGIFGINEPIIFGLPIVLNPIMLVPFILTPVVNTVLAIIATTIGFVPITSGVQLPWTMPIFFSGYLISGSFTAVILQAVLLIVDMLLYFPFLKLLDNKYLEEEKANADKKDELDDLSFDDLTV